MGQENTGKSKHTAIKVIGTLLLIAAAAFIVWFKWFGGRDVLIGSQIDQQFDCGEFMIKMESTMKQADQDELDKKSEELSKSNNTDVKCIVYTNHNETVSFSSAAYTLPKGMTKSDLSKAIMGNAKKLTEYKEISSNDNTLKFTYKNDEDGKTCYSYYLFKSKGNKTYWFNFTCYDNYRDDYESRFDKWADSITLV
ncbi:MAG: hypothetical protein II168_06675 [Ruminococcus sp.]|nr:hypothetical protein [Ruminococcus sp.]